MNDTNLYHQILGLNPPWDVFQVKIDLEHEAIEVHVHYSADTALCPDCGKTCLIYDHREIRRWRHLDTCQMKTYLVCAIPRVKCPDHNVHSITIPWALSSSRFTTLFESFAIDLLRATRNQKKAASILHISFDQIHHIMLQAVARGLDRRDNSTPISYIGIDEKSISAGHKYATVLININNSSVIDMAENRDEQAASQLLNNSLSDVQKQSIKAVSMDMWKAFMKAVNAQLPDAAIVHDKFHLFKYLNAAIDQTRRDENKKLSHKDHNPLLGARYLFLKNQQHLTDSQRTRFQQLQELNLLTSQAWTIKETFKGFYDSQTINEAKFFFTEWFDQVMKSTIEPMKKVAKMFVDHSVGLLNYISYRITNAIAESINSLIEQIKRTARGFRAYENFRISVLFYLGKLDLYPQKTQ